MINNSSTLVTIRAESATAADGGYMTCELPDSFIRIPRKVIVSIEDDEDNMIPEHGDCIVSEGSCWIYVGDRDFWVCYEGGLRGAVCFTKDFTNEELSTALDG